MQPNGFSRTYRAVAIYDSLWWSFVFVQLVGNHIKKSPREHICFRIMNIFFELVETEEHNLQVVVKFIILKGVF